MFVRNLIGLFTMMCFVFGSCFLFFDNIFIGESSKSELLKELEEKYGPADRTPEIPIAALNRGNFINTSVRTICYIEDFKSNEEEGVVATLRDTHRKNSFLATFNENTFKDYKKWIPFLSSISDKKVKVCLVGKLILNNPSADVFNKAFIFEVEKVVPVYQDITQEEAEQMKRQAEEEKAALEAAKKQEENQQAEEQNQNQEQKTEKKIEEKVEDNNAK